MIVRGFFLKGLLSSVRIARMRPAGLLVVVCLLGSTALWPQSSTVSVGTSQDAESTKSEQPQGTAPAPLRPDSPRLEQIKMVQPLYPFSADKDKLQGQVNVKFKVSQSGDVESAEIASGNALLGKAAVDAVKDWKFEPFIRNGKPTEVSSTLLFDFIFCDKAVQPSEATAGDKPSDAGTRKGIKVVRLSANALTSLLLHRVNPVYPALAKQGRVQGAVLIFVGIGKDGTVQLAHIISGHPLLAESALAAVKQWRFRPLVLEGDAVDLQTTITINFTANEF